MRKKLQCRWGLFSVLCSMEWLHQCMLKGCVWDKDTWRQGWYFITARCSCFHADAQSNFDLVISFLKFNSDSEYLKWICVCIYRESVSIQYVCVCVCVCVCVNGYRGKTVLVSLVLNRVDTALYRLLWIFVGPFLVCWKMGIRGSCLYLQALGQEHKHLPTCETVSHN